MYDESEFNDLNPYKCDENMPVKIEKPCHVIVSNSIDFECMSETQLRQELEKGDDKTKYNCMQNLLIQMQNGEKFPNLLMTIIRFVMPVQNNLLKKLLMIYWEMVNKHSSDGKLLSEMILVCDAYRRDLTHPNEFVRGATLRFLCRLKEPEIIAPLMPAIRSCLEHRLPYVRRNAIVAIYSIFQNYPHLITDAVDLIANYLETEQDNSCRRNAFIVLKDMDEQCALDYIERRLDLILNFNDSLQLVVVEFIHKHCLINPNDNSVFVSILFNLMATGSTTVRFECAGALMSIASAYSVKMAAQCYIDIGSKESDNNVKLVILDRLFSINEAFSDQNILQDMAVDIFQIIDSPDIDVAEKTVKLVMDLISIRNITDIMGISRRALTKSYASVEESVSQRKRQLIVSMLHECSIKFPDISKECALMLLELLPQFGELSARAVLNFVKMTMVQHSLSAKSLLLTKLLEHFPFIEISSIVKDAIWLIAEFATDTNELIDAFNVIQRSLGEIVQTECSLKPDAIPENVKAIPQVNQDGSYVTQSAFVTAPNVSRNRNDANVESILKNIKTGYGLAVAVATACCKIVIRLKNDTEFSEQVKFERITSMICMKFLEMAEQLEENSCSSGINKDEYDRIQLCLKIMQDYNPKVAGMFETSNRRALSVLINKEHNIEEDNLGKLLASKLKSEEVDEAISFDFLNLKSQNARNNELANIDWVDRAIRDILLVNRTAETLQNVTVEIATVGNLKVVERPVSITMGPGNFSTVNAHIKVNSTENAVIHGNIVYDLSNGKSECVVLNELKINVLDYINSEQPMTHEQFRQMWIKFEWENKINVNTKCDQLDVYVQRICEATGMNVIELPDENIIESEAGFLSANLYGQSVFREDILANVSIEKTAENEIVGHIRIRAKTQGMALSMGEKMNMSQRLFTPAKQE
ncbi:hypothetical protein GJ496_006092 [Pomphorhynchus laevis]|nr:hypothetical protein GJ496_006092 [Pomphorhynchus laevis]